MICAVAAVLALWRGRLNAALLALLVNFLLFVVFLPRQSYIDPVAAPRVAAGVAVAAIASLAAATRAARSRPWFYAASVLWLLPLPAFLVLDLLDRPSGLVRG
jgi:hypothetical protein